MQYFRRLKKNVDVTPLNAEIARRPGIWQEQTGRQRIAVQREALAIPIRGIRKSCIRGRKRRDVHESRFTTLARELPVAVAFIREFADEMNAELARAKIVSLPPGGKVYEHCDRGEYYADRDRFHLVLDSAGSWMRCADEEVRMRTGELWWFDNKRPHEARNDSDRDRVHLIFDLKPRRGAVGDLARPEGEL
ncbi:MAG: aspartyl/asparaginyl beta-hydroxylase domain-containing protein [Myxococcota bacterium]